MTGGYVKVCDSLYDDLAGSTKVQLAQCYQNLIDEFGCLEVDIPPVQTQAGSVDCGLFAIAFAYELAVGHQPVHEVRFDQTKMRSHLLSCFEKRELTHFPQTVQARRQPTTQPRLRKNVTIATSAHQASGHTELHKRPDTLKKGTTGDGDYQARLKEHDPGYVIPAPENPVYTELDKYRLQGRNDRTYQKLVKRDSDYVIPAHERRGYETPGQNKMHEKPKKSPETDPGYAELDVNRLQGRNDCTYQKLVKRDSDYVIPAHERRESYIVEDMITKS